MATINSKRTAIGALVLSASAFGSLLLSEGWEDTAKPPLPGDVPTYGFGTTTDDRGQPLKGGERITPPKAVIRALADVQKFEGAVKKCVRVPLHQYEYDAYIELSYNIGTTNFCNSTLVKKLNAEQYEEACREILRWDRFQGVPNAGLAKRRQREYQTCMGGAL